MSEGLGFAQMAFDPGKLLQGVRLLYVEPAQVEHCAEVLTFSVRTQVCMVAIFFLAPPLAAGLGWLCGGRSGLGRPAAVVRWPRREWSPHISRGRKSVTSCTRRSVRVTSQGGRWATTSWAACLHRASAALFSSHLHKLWRPSGILPTSAWRGHACCCFSTEAQSVGRVGRGREAGAHSRHRVGFPFRDAGARGKHAAKVAKPAKALIGALEDDNGPRDDTESWPNLPAVASVP